MSAPARDLIAAAKSDTVDQPAGVSRGVVFGGAGVLRILTADGQDRTIPSGVLAAGMVHPVRVRRVFNSTTTATDVWLVY